MDGIGRYYRHIPVILHSRLCIEPEKYVGQRIIRRQFQYGSAGKRVGDVGYVYEFGHIFRDYRTYSSIAGAFHHVVDPIDLSDSADHDYLRHKLAPDGSFFSNTFYP